jgi:hypothetical protein
LLYHGEPRTSLSTSKLLCFFLLVAIILFGVSFIPCPSTKQTHEKIRREWEAEERAHQVIRDSLNSERQAMVVERGTWQKERADHILEREAIAAEREQWRKERVDHENRQRREEEEKRALIVWENLTPSNKCLRYGTREYSATLAHVPLGMDPLKECWKKSVDIHGRQIFPSRCDTEVRFFFWKILVIEFSGFRVSSSFFFSFYFRESAGLLRAIGMSTSTKLHVLHGGGVMTTRYSSIYFYLYDTLMATTGLRRARNSCLSSCYQSYLVHITYMFFYTALRIFLGEPPMGRRLARHVCYHSWTGPGQGF